MKPVVILGAGINGAALARELAVNRVPVHVVDIGDVASGATAYSSRLIHGGLRYLEHGEFRLVRESLAERATLLRQAPHLVKPLRLHIPAARRLGGLFSAGLRFLGLSVRPRSRGAWVIRMGLSYYDRMAEDTTLPKHASMRATDAQAIKLAAEQFPWQMAYSDAQVLYPERLVLAMLEDARRSAEQHHVDFQVTPHGDAALQERMLYVRYLRASERVNAGMEIAPSLIVNATGAWVDHALRRLDVATKKKRHMGGTSGSHLVVSHAQLADRLAGRGLYCEAKDGRPFFVLPFGTSTLVGTTDLPFEGDPRDARATDAELYYLLDSLNGVFDDITISKADVAWRYCGVRPLPASDKGDPSSVTRDHQIVEHEDTGIPMISLVGGKLTTARALAEQAADKILGRLNLRRIESTESRPLPGATRLGERMLDAEMESRQLAQEHAVDPGVALALWNLYGDETGDVIHTCRRKWPDNWGRPLPGSCLPEAIVRYAIAFEWAQTIDDVVSRRLMLLVNSRVTIATLERIGQIMAEEGVFPGLHTSAQVKACRNALADRYGVKIGE